MEVDIDSYLAQINSEKASEDPEEGQDDTEQAPQSNKNDDNPMERVKIIPIYAFCTVFLAIATMLLAEIKIVCYVSSSIAIFVSGVALIQGRKIRNSASKFRID
jgi:hypothetical protein